MFIILKKKYYTFGIVPEVCCPLKLFVNNEMSLTLPFFINVAKYFL